GILDRPDPRIAHKLGFPRCSFRRLFRFGSGVVQDLGLVPFDDGQVRLDDVLFRLRLFNFRFHHRLLVFRLDFFRRRGRLDNFDGLLGWLWLRLLWVRRVYPRRGRRGRPANFDGLLGWLWLRLLWFRRFYRRRGRWWRRTFHAAV